MIIFMQAMGRQEVKSETSMSTQNVVSYDDNFLAGHGIARSEVWNFLIWCTPQEKCCNIFILQFNAFVNYTHNFLHFLTIYCLDKKGVS